MKHPFISFLVSVQCRMKAPEQEEVDLSGIYEPSLETIRVPSTMDCKIQSPSPSIWRLCQSESLEVVDNFCRNEV